MSAHRARQSVWQCGRSYRNPGNAGCPPEDNDLNWEIAEALLTEEGLELDWAENGQVCVEMLEWAFLVE